MQPKTKKLLVLQFRNGDTKDHEVECFHDELSDYELDIYFESVIEGNLSPELIQDKDAVILGGSGDMFLTKGHGKDSWRQEVFSFIDLILKQNIPLLGICFGAQLITLHQGGEITNHEEYHETGTCEVFLKETSQRCDLFSQLPEKFKVQLGHKDTPIEEGEDMISLAYSEDAPIQAFKIQDKQAWGILFHPELNADRIRDRLKMLTDYLPGEDVEEGIMKEVDNEALGHQVLHKFLQTFIFDQKVEDNVQLSEVINQVSKK